MAEAIVRGDPTGWIARQFIGAGTSTHLPVRVDTKALSFTGTAAGSLLSWQNPENVAILATTVLDITTAGTGTAGCDVGVGTLGGSADNLLDAGRVDTVAVISPLGTGGGTNGKPWRKVAAKGSANDYIVGKMTEVDATAAGSGYILYIPVS